MSINDLMNTLKEPTNTPSETLSAFILLDRSGSMSGGRWENAIGSINEYVKTLNTEGVNAEVTIAVFDSFAPYNKTTTNTVSNSVSAGLMVRGLNGNYPALDFYVIRNAQYLNEYKPLTLDEVSPRGGTPLYDATARMIDIAKERNNDKTVIVIMTDGEENSSKEHNLAAIKARIADCEKKDWDVLFLGAEFNADAVASSYGIGIDKVLNTASAADLSQTMNFMATSNAGYARSGTRADTTVMRSKLDNK